MKKFLESAARKPLIVLALIIVISIGFLLSMTRNATLETNLDKYMPATHPAFVFSDQAEELFGIQDAVLFAVEHPESIYNPGTLEKIKDITNALSERFEEIRPQDITSLYTAENITASEWGLEVEPFYTQALVSAQELDKIRKAVEGNEMINGRIVSKDGRSTLIIAQIQGEAFAGNFYEELQDFAAEWEGPEKIYVAGRPVVEGELGKLGPKDMVRMAPLVLVLMIVILLILLRNIRDTAINIIIVLFGTLTAFGVMALFKIPVYAVDTMIPVMLIAIGVAYGIHMHNSIHYLVEENPLISKQELVEKTLKAMIRPVSMAAITTAVGFSSLMTSQVLPVRFFGLFTSLGVMAEMFLALILFPTSIYLLGPPRLKKKTERKLKKELVSAGKNRGENILKHPFAIAMITAAIAILGIYGSTKVWIDTSFLANFEKTSNIAVTDKFVNENFGGTSTLNVIFEAEQDDTFKEPEVLRLIDSLQRDLETDPMVGESFAITDYMRRMHKVMNEEDPAYDVIPDSRELIAQYLLLYEMSGDPDNLNKIVDYDYRTANLTFQLKSDSSDLMGKIIDQLEAGIDGFEEYGVSVRYAGSGYKALIFADLLLQGQIISLLLSFVIVALLLALLFKNLLIGIAGTIPIAVTAVVNFGTMGLLGIPLSSATALISSIAVGIGVDYAIHLIEHYRVRRIEGFEITKAALETFSHTGRAILYNTLAVMGGFAVLLISVFPPNRQVGGLIVLNMATSAIGTLTILLIILVHIDRKGKLIKAKTNKEIIS